MGDLAAVNGFVWEHSDVLTDYDEIRFCASDKKDVIFNG